jgi:hypothetical protein
MVATLWQPFGCCQRFPPGRSLALTLSTRWMPVNCTLCVVATELGIRMPTAAATKEEPMAADPVMPPVHPGEILLEEFLTPLGVSQYQLAKAVDIPARRINEIVHDQRRITAAPRCGCPGTSVLRSGSG